VTAELVPKGTMIYDYAGREVGRVTRATPTSAWVGKDRLVSPYPGNYQWYGTAKWRGIVVRERDECFPEGTPAWEARRSAIADADAERRASLRVRNIEQKFSRALGRASQRQYTETPEEWFARLNALEAALLGVLGEV
jgi:hypothetical protein